MKNTELMNHANSTHGTIYVDCLDSQNQYNLMVDTKSALKLLGYRPVADMRERSVKVNDVTFIFKVG